MKTSYWIAAVIVVLILVGGYLGRHQIKSLISGSTSAPVPATTTDNSTANNTPDLSANTDATSPASPTADQNMVTLSAQGFSPATLTVKVGTKVTWTNQSGAPATVNSDPHPTHTDFPPLNLGKFADGASLSLIFDKPGTYGYHNHLMPSEKATIVVLQ